MKPLFCMILSMLIINGLYAADTAGTTSSSPPEKNYLRMECEDLTLNINFDLQKAGIQVAGQNVDECTNRSYRPLQGEVKNRGEGKAAVLCKTAALNITNYYAHRTVEFPKSFQQRYGLENNILHCDL